MVDAEDLKMSSSHFCAFRIKPLLQPGTSQLRGDSDTRQRHHVGICGREPALTTIWPEVLAVQIFVAFASKQVK